MAEYIIATKFYNEENQLPCLIENIATQKVRPMIVVFLDDGSVDSSANIAMSEATKHGLDFQIVSMPAKKKGNLDTLGRIWTKAQPLLRDLSKNVEYIATIDVDTTVEPQYFGDMINYLETYPSIGVVAGQAQHEPKRTFPMFSGKVFRSTILKKIDKYWDISIDSFINVKALKMGYKLKILDVPVNTPETHLRTSKGRFRSGRLAYYTGTSLFYVLAKGILKFDAQYLRGYWSEWTRGIWQSKDEDIREYYGNLFRLRLLSMVKRIL
ncbi:MAG: glycosyltransferase family 2 protein [Candidatus Thorarchaeota archaeon]|nr:glycosyltransferase family 2 protein [Candidatus Thorarchaeota archaeon]